MAGSRNYTISTDMGELYIYRERENISCPNGWVMKQIPLQIICTTSRKTLVSKFINQNT